MNMNWDAHGCPPLHVGASLDFLSRYKNAGLNFVSLNVGFDLMSQEETLNLIEYYIENAKQNNNYSLISNIDDLEKNSVADKLSIAFDLEGCNLLDGDVDKIDHLYQLGVRQIAFVYNKANLAGSGCLDHTDNGLTSFGKALVRKCNEVGMVIDCSHLSYRASLDVMDISSDPIIFSHSNPKAMFHHPRNITDDQITACANIGGVIGVNGVSMFLGAHQPSAKIMADNIDYLVNLVGIDHVGIGMDCLFDCDEIEKYVKANPNSFPTESQNQIAILEPEEFKAIEYQLQRYGYKEEDLQKIMGLNFLRIAKTVWK